jgi:hypothetical protein
VTPLLEPRPCAPSPTPPTAAIFAPSLDPGILGPARSRLATTRPASTSLSWSDEEIPMSKKTKKRRLRARRNKANHGKRPLVGRR